MQPVFVATIRAAIAVEVEWCVRLGMRHCRVRYSSKVECSDYRKYRAVLSGDDRFQQGSLQPVLTRLVAIVVLLALNGFFVAAEFALVRSRRTRLESMARTGDWMARIALRASGNLARVLSASQLGITLASLALGWLAEDAFGTWVAAHLSGLPFNVAVSLRVGIGAAVALTLV